MKRFFLVLALLLASSLANAATKTWTGTGLWSTTNGANWSGGTAPIAGDAIVFDGTSGTGAVTIDPSISGMSFLSIACGAYGGTIDGTTNPVNLTFTATASLSGTGARTLNFAGTWTFTGGVGVTTFDFGTQTNLVGSNTSSLNITFSYAGVSTSQQNFAGGARTYGNFTVTGRSSTSGAPVLFTGVNTFASLTAAGITLLQFNSNQTVTGALTINGTVAAPVFMRFSTLTVGSATINGAAIKEVTFAGAGSPVTANSSFDGGGNANVTINPPTSGGGSRCIGC